MKYLRVAATPEASAAPAAFQLLASAPFVTEARLLAWNLTDSRGVTLLFAVDGDPDQFGAAIETAPEPVATDLTPVDDERFYLLTTLDTESETALSGVFETVTTDGLVVVKPVFYRDGGVHARLVGETAAVQAAVENLPDAVDVDVREVGQRGFEPASGARLSERQREAVLAALELGYYDQPRGATHEAVAEELGCAPSTATEHLQKAEAKLVRATMAAIAPDEW